MKDFKFHPLAVEELIDITYYYRNISSSLSIRFEKQLNLSIGLIRNMPKVFPIVHKMKRKCNIHTFPYYIIYRELEDFIFIISIAHHKRKPNFWKNRVIN